MAYIISGVGVDLSAQSTRPREPARPQPSVSTSSTMMATRAPRPRETTPITATTNKYLQQVVSLKGQQAQLESLLPKMKAELIQATKAEKMHSANGNRVGASAAAAVALDISKAIVACVEQIKACAAKANYAADSAIQNGATKAQVQTAAQTGASSGGSPVVTMTAAVMPGTVKSITGSTPTKIGPAPDIAVEAPTARIDPGGNILPGPGAQVVETPVLTDPSVPDATKQDVTVSSGSLGTLAFIGGAALLGYFVLRKKGLA